MLPTVVGQIIPTQQVKTTNFLAHSFCTGNQIQVSYMFLVQGFSGGCRQAVNQGCVIF